MKGFRVVLSESQAVEDLTHEALTHHGFEIDGPSRRAYSKGGDGGEGDVYDTSYHQSLSDAGWKVHHHFSYKEHPDGDDHDEYSHDENSPHTVYDNRIWHHPDHPDKSPDHSGRVLESRAQRQPVGLDEAPCSVFYEGTRGVSMKGFRAVLRESDEFSSMPHDHLHAELHGVFTKHGSEPQQYEDTSPHFSSHGWRSKASHYPGHNEDTDDFESHSEQDAKIQSHLPALGFKRSPIHDIDVGNHPHMDQDNASFGSEAWTHPNGSMLYAHRGFDEHHDDYLWTDYELRTPRAR